jgi:hypothetical protein
VRGQLFPPGSERRGQLTDEPAEQLVAAVFGRRDRGRHGRRRVVACQRLEEDLRLALASQLGQLDKRAAGDPAEGIRVRVSGDPADVDEGQVDIPQN